MCVNAHFLITVSVYIKEDRESKRSPPCTFQPQKQWWSAGHILKILRDKHRRIYWAHYARSDPWMSQGKFPFLSCSISLFCCYFVHGEYIYDPNNDQFGPESMLLWSKKKFQGPQRQNLRNRIVCGTKIRTDLGERRSKKPWRQD